MVDCALDSGAGSPHNRSAASAAISAGVSSLRIIATALMLRASVCL